MIFIDALLWFFLSEFWSPLPISVRQPIGSSEKIIWEFSRTYEEYICLWIRICGSNTLVQLPGIEPELGACREILKKFSKGRHWFYSSGGIKWNNIKRLIQKMSVNAYLYRPWTSYWSGRVNMHAVSYSLNSCYVIDIFELKSRLIKKLT